MISPLPKRTAEFTASATERLRTTAESGLWFRLVPAFAAGYFLSYGLRSVNAVIAPELTRDLGISSAQLGLLTSAYFLAFGLFQLPLGILLDRYGPRRVESTLLVVAAMGCALFGVGESLEVLAFSRALIGLGVSACLMASFKAFSQWFSSDRLPSLTATIMVAGGLGAVSASVPVEAALPVVGWRGLFFICTILLILVAGFLLTAVPDGQSAAGKESFATQLRALKGIYWSLEFWRFAPQSCVIVGGFMAIQGLWAVPWMIEVNRSTRAEAANILFLTSVAMLFGFLFIACCSGFLVRRGVSPMRLLTGGMGLALLAQLAIILGLADPHWLWPLLGLSFSLGNIAYSQLSTRFPLSLAGRVNTALNLMVFVGAFSLQWGFGAVVDAFGAAGLSKADAFRASFSLLLGVELLAFVWFVFPRKIRP